MPDWNPAAARAKFNLVVSPADRAKAEANMAPLARDPAGFFDADAVFEGGGVLGTAFLGAVRVCADLGLRWHALAGTSAGAITAALLAADLNIDQLEQVVGTLDYAKMVAQKTSWRIFDTDPSDDLDNPLRLMTNLMFAQKLGEYSTEPFRDWLDGILKWAGKTTFADVWDRSKVAADRQLKVVVSDLTTGEMKVLPDDLDAATRGAKPYRLALSPRQRQFRVAEAVRLSMSIPFVFAPGTLDHPTDGPCVIVDGGILSNFPLWLYDEDVPGKPPAWPTFGFRLVDKEAAGPQQIDGVTGLLRAMLKTMMQASDRRYLSQRHQGRVIDIDLTGLNVTATQFHLTESHKDELYRRGYVAAKEFFTTKWSWPEHLKTRGF